MRAMQPIKTSAWMSLLPAPHHILWVGNDMQQPELSRKLILVLLAQHIQDGASEPVIGATSYHAGMQQRAATRAILHTDFVLLAIDNQDGASEPVTSITSHPLGRQQHAAINAFLHTDIVLWY